MENQILKSFTVDRIHNDKQRSFKCWGSVEVKDRHGEIIEAEEVYKVMDIWMDRGAPIMFNHTNRQVGKGLNWQPLEKNGKPGVLITAKIYDHYTEDDEVWQGIKKGEFEGLSIGGKSYVRDETEKGTYLRDLIGYEFSVVERTGNQEATMVEHNALAKAGLPEGAVPLGDKTPPKGAKIVTGPRGGKYIVPGGESDTESKKPDYKSRIDERAEEMEEYDDVGSEQIVEIQSFIDEGDVGAAKDLFESVDTDTRDAFLEAYTNDYQDEESAKEIYETLGLTQTKPFKEQAELLADLKNSYKKSKLHKNKTNKKMVKENIKKEDELVVEEQPTDNEFEGKVMALFDKISERLDAIEERISGGSQEEDAVEETKEESEEETEDTEKEYDEEEDKEDMTKALKSMKKELSDIKKSMVKEVIKTERPAQVSRKEDSQDLNKSIDSKIEEMKKSGKFNFKEVAAEIRKAQEKELNKKFNQ